MADKPVRAFGPLALTNAYGTNIYQGGNGGTSSIYDLIYSIHIVNKGGVNATFRLFLGATGGTAAGTELYFDYPVAANSYVDLPFYGGMRMESTDFLTGGASASTTLTITGFGRQAVK